MQFPHFSAVIPTRNRPALTVAAVRSAMDQTVEDVEAIVVDDGSTDETPDVIEQTFSADPRVRVLRKEHGGVSAARNLGIDNALGEFVGLLDSDDTWHPHYVDRQLQAFQSAPDADLSLCDILYVGDSDHAGTTLFSRSGHVVPASLHTMLEGAWVQTSQIALRRSRLGELRFDESYAVCEDLEFLMHAYARGLRSVVIPEALVSYRLHDQFQATDDGLAIQRGTLRALEQYAGHAPNGVVPGFRLHHSKLRARVLIKEGQLRDARPFLWTWFSASRSLRPLRYWLRSFVAPR